ncbi:MAG: O-antigen ligase family protein [Acidimicrobiaceae bacterium]|nr:O-antigen ligase family protein [Acidimicrobiaceae bacterium]
MFSSKWNWHKTDWQIILVSAALLVFTNGPVFLFSRRVVDRTGLWEDLAVWPFLAAAAISSAVLAVFSLRRGDLQWSRTLSNTSLSQKYQERTKQQEPTKPGAGINTHGDDGEQKPIKQQEPTKPLVSRTAAVAVFCYPLTAMVSTFWSFNSEKTLWRSTIYVGMTLLAFVIAGFNYQKLGKTLMVVAGAAVASSLLLVSLKPEIAVDLNGDWRGVYTNRNSLGPLAAIGVIVGLYALFNKVNNNDNKIRSNAQQDTAHHKPQHVTLKQTLNRRLRRVGLIQTTRMSRSGNRPWQQNLCLRLAGLILLLASSVAMVGAGSRTAWLALLVAVTVTSALLAYHRSSNFIEQLHRNCQKDKHPAKNNPLNWQPRTHRRLLVATAVFASITAVVVAVFGVTILWDESTFVQRRTIWRLVWDLILDKPLTGYGFFMFWEESELTESHELLRRGSAHNSLLETGLGLGIIGVAPFVIIVFLAAWNALGDLRKRPAADTWMWAAMVLFLLIENITESFILWFSYNWILLMAAAIRASQPTRNQAESPNNAQQAVSSSTNSTSGSVKWRSRGSPVDASVVQSKAE